jgi:hypothetical protein
MRIFEQVAKKNTKKSYTKAGFHAFLPNGFDKSLINAIAAQERERDEAWWCWCSLQRERKT